MCQISLARIKTVDLLNKQTHKYSSLYYVGIVVDSLTIAIFAMQVYLRMQWLKQRLRIFTWQTVDGEYFIQIKDFSSIGA